MRLRSGRQDATLYGKRNARCYLVAVSSISLFLVLFAVCFERTRFYTYPNQSTMP